MAGHLLTYKTDAGEMIVVVKLVVMIVDGGWVLVVSGQWWCIVVRALGCHCDG